ncbi:translin [Tanacetum coccineum]
MSTVGNSSPTFSIVKKQFDEFRHRLDESGTLRDKIKYVATEIESNTRIMHSIVLLVHQSRPITEVLEKTKTRRDVMNQLFSQLLENFRQSPGQ